MKADREAVKTLAIAVGVREAARRLNLNENTVISWSKRDNWQIAPAKPNGPERNQPAIKPSDALKSLLEDDSKETKLSLSKGVRRLAKHIETMPEPILFTGADKVKAAVNSASMLHNWQEAEQGSGVMGGLKVYSQQTVIAVQPKE
jgi:hypothetical protein